MSAFTGVGGVGGAGGYNGGWNGGSGGGGGGDWSLPGHNSPASNVLGDVAVNEAPEMVEEVILLDVGGGLPCHVFFDHATMYMHARLACRAVTQLSAGLLMLRTRVPRAAVRGLYTALAVTTCCRQACKLCMHAGMKCGGCVGHVKKVLEAQEGVTEVRHGFVHDPQASPPRPRLGCPAAGPNNSFFKCA